MAANGFDDDQTRSFTNLAAGTIVSHYKIISKIGAGGMGEVYLAEDTQLDRKVALKFLPPHLSHDEAARARFTREAKAAAKLDHPNIVPVYEVGEYQGRPYFAMAHIEGKPLKEVIKERKLSINEAIELTKQICEGLHKAHELGVIHRDIKPGNIIIDSDKKARILDFGLATVSGEEKLTKTGSTLGTVGYMSPEQIREGKADRRSDIFSAGVVLYEMITGRSPFEADHEAAIQYNIVNEQPEPMSRYRSGIRGELQQVIDKALTKDPSLRYQHADGMLSDLLHVYQKTSERRIQTRIGSRRKRFGALAYLLLALSVIAVGIIGITVLPRSGERQAIIPEFRKITYTGDAYYSAISPDGSYYAYSRFTKDPDGRTVYVSDFEGGRAISVFEGDWVQSICWSPDGKELLLRGRRAGDTVEAAVYLVPRLGGHVRKFDVSGSPGFTWWDIAWLPDGSGFVSIADGNRLIYTDKMIGDTTVVLLGREFTAGTVGNFSSDGRWLVIFGVSEDETGLWIVSSDGIDIHRLGDGVFTSPTWSSSGDAVYALEPSLAATGYRLWRFNIDLQSGELKGEPETLLSGLPGTIGISISGDGKRLLCRQYHAIYNLWRVYFDDDGMESISLRREQLTFGTGLISAPSISPDGQYMSYRAESGGDRHVFVRLVEGGDAVQLTRTGAINGPSRWSPDGERIAVLGVESMDASNFYLTIVNKYASSHRRLFVFEGTCSDPWLDWSANDKIIVGCDDWSGLVFVDPETGDTTSWQYDPSNGRIRRSRLSPNGRMMAVTRERVGTDGADIWVYSMTNDSSSLVIDFAAFVLDWSRDDRWVYCFTLDWVIARVNVETSEIDTLAILPDMDEIVNGNMVAMNQDKKWAVYQVSQVQRDIYLIENFDPNVK